MAINRKSSLYMIIASFMLALLCTMKVWAAPGAGTETGTGRETGIVTESGAGTESDAGSESGAGTESDAGAETRAGTETGIRAAAGPEEISPDYKLVTDSGIYELYLYEPTLSILLRNKETGSLLRSTLSQEEDDGINNKTWTAYMQSGLVVTAIKGITDTYQVDLVSCANDITYTYMENGFTAEIAFKEYQFGLSVMVTLEDDQLAVRVPEDSIWEKGKDIYIGTVSLFPMMGYTYLDSQEGYLFIPDGNGALIYLDDKDGRYSTGFSQNIYGADAGFSDSSTEVLLWGEYSTVMDPKKVLAPVYGIIHSEDELGYLAVVEDGEERASIEAHPNGVMVNYNRCFAKFTLRKIYVQPLNNSNSGTMTNVETDRTHSDLEVRFLLVSKEKADYSGMANAYREYLLDNGLVTLRNVEYKTRVDFLGNEREDFLVFKKAVPMTTVGQVREIYENLQNAGVEKVLTIYKGWQSGGLYDIPITKYNADKSIGGTGALTSLIQESGENDYDIYLYNNALQANPEESNTTFNMVKKVNKRRLEYKTRGYVYDVFNYLLPSRTASTLQKFVKTYTGGGADQLALAGITNEIFSYSYSGKYYSRFDCADSYKSTISTLDESTSLILEQPFSYLWNHTEVFLDMPVGSSDYMYEDEEIPFLSMVLKGILPMYSDYVNFEANKNKFRLQMIEAGVYPSFYMTYQDSSDLIYTNSSALYSTRYDIYQDIVAEYDKEFAAIAQVIQDAGILRHDKLEKGVVRVTYDNGWSIYVNYTDKAVTVDGYTVEAMSAKVGESK